MESGFIRIHSLLALTSYVTGFGGRMPPGRGGGDGMPPHMGGGGGMPPGMGGGGRGDYKEMIRQTMNMTAACK